MARHGDLNILYEPAVFVKPSSEANKPHTLRLTNFDWVYDHSNSIALFYAPNPDKNSDDVASVLKLALQELLVHYPWAAGRLRRNLEDKRLEVYYDAQGAQFVSAAAQLRFVELGDVSTLNPALDTLFPSIKTPDGDPENLPLLAIQVTRFSCGGFVLGLRSHHALLDGCSACSFLRNLCSLARSSCLCVPPDHLDRNQRIKPRDPPIPTFDHPRIGSKKSDPLGTGTATKVSFSEEMIEVLRRRALSNGVVQCSRFVAVAAHLLVGKAKVLEVTSPGEEITLRIPVNLRGRFGLEIPSGYMGNACVSPQVKATVKDLREKPLAFAVGKIQEAVGTTTAEFVQSEIDLIEVLGSTACIQPTQVLISSLATFRFYDTDAGWGRPVYVGRPAKQTCNRIIVLAGDAESRTFNVSIVFESEEERSRFENAVHVVP